MSRRLFVINNPTSGSRRKNQRAVRAFGDFAGAKNLDFELFETTTTDNAESIVSSRFENRFTDLVIIGGDGTINEAINGLNYDVPVSIISAGTGNDFVKNLPTLAKIESQLEAIVSNNTMRIDVGHCNDRKFLNGVGVGFDGQIVEDMRSKKVPLLKGHAKYYFHVLQILASFSEKRFKYTLDESFRQDELILMTVGNGTTFGGGFKLMPDAKIDDGLLEICTIGQLAGWKRFLHIGKLSNGTHGKLPMVQFHQASKVNIDSDETLFAHADGEAIGHPPYEIEILAESLTLRV